MNYRSIALYILGLGLVGPGLAAATVPLAFAFDPAAAKEKARIVAATDLYTKERGYGFEPGLAVHTVPGGVVGAPTFYFTTDLPEGNWQVRVTLRGATGGGVAAVKAELRRLMVGPIALAENEVRVRTFIVNTRNPRITARNGLTAGEVKLKAPRETTQEAWAWDDRLTLEINGAVLSALEISPVRVPTIYLLGDSTVCDQSLEPYASWGQMLPRFFQPTVAIANHGESGETYRDSIGRRRLDKVISVMQPGDYLLLQFGHNDQKQIAAGTGGPFTTYQDEMKTHLAAVRRVGGIPVIISPMERRNFEADGKVKPTLVDYARSVREVAAAEGVAFIDLNAMSISLYEALGPDNSVTAFATPGGKVDNTHHNNYGSYALARCLAQGLRGAKLKIADELMEKFNTFDPAQPDDRTTFAVPPSPTFTNQRPLGD